MSSKNDTIALLIASYCDKELLITIESALHQADNKERIHLIICYQDDDLETLAKLKKLPHCEVIHIWKKDAKGSVYARYLCQQKIKDEKYIYQIDAHMRFIKHWDTQMINQLESLHDKKAILSAYPLDCHDDIASLPIDDPFFDKPTCGSSYVIFGFKSPTSYLINAYRNTIDKNSFLAYKKSPYLGAGNLFTYAYAFKEVIFDPHFVFFGDELPMAIRFYTHGYNIYNPGKNYVYHYVAEKPTPFYKSCLEKEEKRFRELLNLDNENKDLGKFGLGKERTLEDYEKFFGIDFKKRIIYMNASTGEFENKKYRNKISYLEQKVKDNDLCLSKPKDIEIVIIDKTNDYQKCLNSCLKSSNINNHLKFLIATTSKEENHDENIKKLIHIDNNTPYCKALENLTKDIGNCYVLLIDSSVRFAQGWDDYYCKKLALCGENSALTSWVWQAFFENYIYKYENSVKEIIKFNKSLPEFSLNKEIKLLERNKPYQTGFISDNLLFCKSDIIKSIPIDPNLTYEEHEYLYSLRLWTYGINIYYPVLSFFMRTSDINNLKEGLKNKGLIDSLSKIPTYEAKRFPKDYPYDIGNIRPTWSWLKFIKAKYNSNKMKLDVDKENK